MSDDLTNLRAAAEAAGMRLPLTTDKWGDAIYNGDNQPMWTSEAADIATVNYLVAAANAAPGLAAEVAEWAAVGSHALDLFDPMCKGRAPHPSDVRRVLGAVKATNASLRAKRDAARAEVARLTQERDGLRGLLREAADRLLACPCGCAPDTELAARIRREGGLTDE